MNASYLSPALALLAALASSPEAAAQGMFKLDAVLVPKFYTDNPALDAEAARVQAALEANLAQRFLVVPMAAVPPFPDYSADIYLRSCPKAEYIECSYLVGARAKANWVLVVRYKKPEARGDEGLPVAEVSIVDVNVARSILNFEAIVRPGQENEFAEGVANVLSRVIDGDAAAAVDIRGQVEDPRVAWERRRAAAEAAAEDIESDGKIEVSVQDLDFESGLKTPKITDADLARYDDRDDGTPWQRLDMSRQEYLLYKNSGKPLAEWRALAVGRKNRLLVRGSLGGGAGPFHQYFDGRWALDPNTLQTAEVEVHDRIQTAGTALGELSVGYGITPTVDVALRVAGRMGSYEYVLHQEVVGDPEPVLERSPSDVPGAQFGAHVTYAPFPWRTVRPLAVGGVSFWKGVSPDMIVALPVQVAELGPFVPPSLILVEAGAGGELRMSKLADLFVDGGALIKVAGPADVHLTSGGPGMLATRYVPEEPAAGMGFWLRVGITFRFALEPDANKGGFDIDDIGYEDEDEP